MHRIHDKKLPSSMTEASYIHKVAWSFAVFTVRNLDAALESYRSKLGLSVASNTWRRGAHNIT